MTCAVVHGSLAMHMGAAWARLACTAGEDCMGKEQQVHIARASSSSLDGVSLVWQDGTWAGDWEIGELKCDEQNLHGENGRQLVKREGLRAAVVCLLCKRPV